MTCNRPLDAERIARAIKITRFPPDPVEEQDLEEDGWLLRAAGLDAEGGGVFIDRALVLNPSLARAWLSGGWVRNWLGQPELAIQHFTQAMRPPNTNERCAYALAQRQ